MLHYTGSYRVEFNVPGSSNQILFLHEEAGKSPLPKMALPAFLEIILGTPCLIASSLDQVSSFRESGTSTFPDRSPNHHCQGGDLFVHDGGEHLSLLLRDHWKVILSNPAQSHGRVVVPMSIIVQPDFLVKILARKSTVCPGDHSCIGHKGVALVHQVTSHSTPMFMGHDVGLVEANSSTIQDLTPFPSFLLI
jgi:hypothetical protein